MEYAVIVSLDVDVYVPDDTEASEVEQITEERVRSTIMNRGEGIRVKGVRAKSLGKSEKFGA